MNSFKVTLTLASQKLTDPSAIDIAESISNILKMRFEGQETTRRITWEQNIPTIVINYCVSYQYTEEFIQAFIAGWYYGTTLDGSPWVK